MSTYILLKRRGLHVKFMLLLYLAVSEFHTEYTNCCFVVCIIVFVRLQFIDISIIVSTCQQQL